MQNKKLSEEEVQKFMQGCEDLMLLGKQVYNKHPSSCDRPKKHL